MAPTTEPPVIGQHEAIRVLKAVSPANILLVGTPGMGKTYIAQWYMHYLTVEHDDWSVLVDGGKINDVSALSYLYTDSGFSIANYPGPVTVDEIQVVENIEQFYPLLDKPVTDNKGVWIFTTTDEGDLPPAFLSRLRIIALRPYSQHELAQIAEIAAPELPLDTRLKIAQLAYGSPRQVKQLSVLVSNLGKRHNRIVQAAEVVGVMRYMGYEYGLNSRCVELLRSMRDGPRSISTIAALMGTGGRTIRLWETELVYAGLMTITSRGRALTEQGRRMLALIDRNQTQRTDKVDRVEQ